ncbi:hypothetical protein MTO96_048585 [Rhipicephalus appendiculatus]
MTRPTKLPAYSERWGRMPHRDVGRDVCGLGTFLPRRRCKPGRPPRLCCVMYKQHVGAAAQSGPRNCRKAGPATPGAQDDRADQAPGVLRAARPDAAPRRWTPCLRVWNLSSPTQMQPWSPSQTLLCDVQAARWCSRPVKTTQLQESRPTTSGTQDMTGLTKVLTYSERRRRMPHRDVGRDVGGLETFPRRTCNPGCPLRPRCVIYKQQVGAAAQSRPHNCRKAGQPALVRRMTRPTKLPAYSERRGRMPHRDVGRDVCGLGTFLPRRRCNPGRPPRLCCVMYKQHVGAAAQSRPRNCRKAGRPPLVRRIWQG